MENTEAKIYSEVYALIQLAGETYQDMLPDKVKDTISTKRDKNYTPVYNFELPLEKQNIQKDSLAILANIEYNYWCKTEQDKKDFIKELKQIDKNTEEKLRELYNPDHIFERNKPNIQTTTTEEVALVEVKPIKWYEKIFAFFKNLFTKNN